MLSFEKMNKTIPIFASKFSQAKGFNTIVISSVWVGSQGACQYSLAAVMS